MQNGRLRVGLKDRSHAWAILSSLCQLLSYFWFAPYTIEPKLKVTNVNIGISELFKAADAQEMLLYLRPTCDLSFWMKKQLWNNENVDI